MKSTLEEQGWQGFLELCSKTESPEDLDRLLCLFLTIEERAALAARFLVISELVKGKLTQREIAESCKASIGQITRGSNALKIIDAQLKQFLKNNL
ncbi:MAG: trp operon repressor [Candidatus Protochlamydia sp.]|nr:trp operon repressor [Candidatus Protochlamydia sp.]